MTKFFLIELSGNRHEIITGDGGRGLLCAIMLRTITQVFGR